MFGKTDFFHFVIFFISTFSLITDIVNGKIYNWLTIPSIVLGFFFSFLSMNWFVISQSFFGFFIAIILFGFLYLNRIIAAGDVKLLMALGCWGGFFYTLKVAFFSILIGGFFSLFFLILKKRVSPLLKEIYFSVFFFIVDPTCFIKPKIDENLKFPFGVPISISAILNLFL